MREKSSPECTTHVDYMSGTNEMCSRDSPSLHPALANANGKNSSPQASPKTETSLTTKIDNNLLPTPGGRLKFFKDGKFILELSHRRDGERTTWFPVPKKTFWPPASTTPNRQESSTSLSVSDDNSSIQSSPWQRDHCWKQLHPRKCTTSELNFYYRRDPNNRLCVSPRKLLRKRRRPLDTTLLLQQQQQQQQKQQQQKQQKIQQKNTDLNKLYNQRPLIPKVINSNNNSMGRTLTLIIDKLSRLDPNVVSPRKRILRELERVTLEDQASKRRATPPQSHQQGQGQQQQQQQQHQPFNVTLSPSSTITTSTITTTSMTINSTIQSPKQLSSYSITSILGEDHNKTNQEPGFLRNLLKLDDGNNTVKYTSSTNHNHNHHNTYTRTRGIDPYVPSTNTTIHHHHHPLYGVPMLPPGPFRTTGHWMHYPSTVHYPPPLPIYPPPPPPHPSSSPVHHYKDYREQTLTPPSDMPLNLSKHAG